ncbi:heparan-sulfate 6-O-sulfotransferase 2 [Biomphalaria glabrata]|nr:heparan-sulfate 6-O-sulfotransferase 2-like [Biomphalaria glabrata]KAI8772427.1 heparan-sulfate 6-O-sulfotransferase 2 [Biomphalaria glabrata]
MYSCNGSLCLKAPDLTPVAYSDFEAFLQGKVLKHKFNISAIDRVFELDLEDRDILIYLHIQKTGGAAFGRHLVHNLDLTSKCMCEPEKKKCDCTTKNKKYWLLSRHSTGWVCGLHADWTELNDCVDEWFKKNEPPTRTQRRYHYITFLRNPVNRFFSEWQHVKRGATWKAVRLHCNGRDATLDEVPFCFSGPDWSGVSFEEFVSCQHNLAFNRMTRMLSNLSKINCYNKTNRNEKLAGEIMLKSAKENLLNFSFFGILEEQEKTQFLFENTFGIRFIESLKPKPITHVSQLNITRAMHDAVVDKTRLDIQLYQFAKDLFLQRVESMEAHLGYTVEDYFNSARNSAKKVEKVVPKEEEFPEENEETEEDDKQVQYPSKATVNALEPKAKR